MIYTDDGMRKETKREKFKREILRSPLFITEAKQEEDEIRFVQWEQKGEGNRLFFFGLRV